jgi:hypothetical protein
MNLRTVVWFDIVGKSYEYASKEINPDWWAPEFISVGKSVM